MIRLTEKFWFLTAALWLSVAMSTFVVATGNHEISEEASTELLEVVGEFEAIAKRRNERRETHNPDSTSFLQPAKIADHKLTCCRFLHPHHERHQQNGFGGHPLI